MIQEEAQTGKNSRTPVGKMIREQYEELQKAYKDFKASLQDLLRLDLYDLTLKKNLDDIMQRFVTRSEPDTLKFLSSLSGMDGITRKGD